MGSRYRKPEDTRIDLSDGDYLIVRKYLTAGEERGATAHLFKEGTMQPGRKPDLDYRHLELSQAIAYLLDWNITDADDRPVVIRDQPYEFVHAALEAMDSAGQREILTAIQAHASAMDQAREDEKKTRAGSNVPAPTFTSVG